MFGSIYSYVWPSEIRIRIALCGTALFPISDKYNVSFYFKAWTCEHDDEVGEEHFSEPRDIFHVQFWIKLLAGN